MSERGRGRNAIFLASLGWEVTGYDIAADALSQAQAYASRAGVTIRTQEASHETFDFGEVRWDLIVCAYCYMRIQDTQWPAVFLKALKPGGVFVFQTSTVRMPVAEIATRSKDFHVLRVEDLDAGRVDNDWGPSRSRRIRVPRGIRLLAGHHRPPRWGRPCSRRSNGSR